MRCDALARDGSESQWAVGGTKWAVQWGVDTGGCHAGENRQLEDAEGRTALACGAWDLATQGRNARPEVGLASWLGAGIPMHNLKISLLFWSNGRLLTLSPNMSPTRQSTTGGQPLYDLAISPFTIPQSLQLSLSLSGQTLHGPAPITGDDGSETNH